MYRVLNSSSKGFCDRYEIISQGIKQGGSENSLNLYVTYSPIIEHAYTRVGKLIG